MSRRLTEIEVIETLLLRGAILPCYRCRVAFTLEDVKTKNIENEHLHEKKLGGADEPFNRAFSHKAKPCHALVTHGNGATSAGSSRNRVAKATDPSRIEKFKVVKRPLDADAVSEPLARCRRCGEYPDACQCQAAPRRSAFAGRRA